MLLPFQAAVEDLALRTSEMLSEGPLPEIQRAVSLSLPLLRTVLADELIHPSNEIIGDLLN